MEPVIQKSVFGSRRTPPKNIGLLELIRGKREQSWKPSIEELRAGFRGWYQRGYLPHFDAPNVTQMVTITLFDSFPVTRRAEWEPILREPEDSERRKKLEAWMDRGYGECWLHRKDVAEVVEGVLLEGDGVQFKMQAWIIMPNHVHLVVDVWGIPLAKLIHQWKGGSARAGNEVLRRRGPFWQNDFFDTVIRDEEHLRKAIRYTEQNATKAHLVKESRDWPWGSSRRRDKYVNLPV